MRSFVLIAAAASLTLGGLAAAQPATGQKAAGRTTAADGASPPAGGTLDHAGTNPDQQAKGGVSNGGADPSPICKSVTGGGSLIPKRECHTQAQWDQMRADAVQDLNTGPSNPGGPH